MRLPFLLLFLLLLAAPAWSAPTAACHCFQERAFDPAQPAAVDPYLLATAQNSFLAVVFDIPKKEVVLARMRGTSGEDLWIAHFTAKKRSLAAADLLAARRQAGTWNEVLQKHGLSPADLGPAFTGARHDAALATAALRTLLIDRLGADPAILDRLHLAGAAPPETILVLFLARKSGREAADLLTEVRAGRSTWGTLLHTCGIPADSLEGEFKKLLR